ncbi:sugar phosphate isomerase/epimerase [Catalinimonas alkaloidigena]|uniref:sugar phosphate isomerase/epimerase family protein n=1 Tax=Catalinimonas alkaloidigena TaxID=1075417 RepID=UPI0024066259|nr:TIM barrel protein [Catalinimonas alkaloidigena]MDF9796671.1 sugar phosphate isomerase/epimerase [Catalinimonas alkaloidigena]
MQLGISSYTYTWSVGVPGNLPQKRLDAFGLIDKAKQVGVPLVQIADNLSLHSLSMVQLGALARHASGSEIALEVGTRGLTEENFYVYLNIAKKLQSPILRMVVDTQDYYPAVEEIISIVKDFVPALKDRNITLAIENHDRFKAREFAQIIEGVGSEYVGICLDSVNSMGAGEGIETVVNILGPYTVNLHIKDFIVERVHHMMGFTIEGKPAGQGMLPIEDMVKTLSTYKRCESAILELWTPPEKELEQTMAKEENWTKESVTYLKDLFRNIKK